MKKVILSLIVSLGVLLMLPALASADTGTTTVDGTVTMSGSPVSGASVTVICNGNSLTDSSTTSAGYYYVQFSAAQCPDGATAKVTATKGADKGTATGPVNNIVTGINIAVVPVTISAVPELGALTGIGAALLGGGAFMIARRRQFSGHKA